MSEIEWLVDRVKLYELRRTAPELSIKELADEIGRSETWTRKWCRRLDAGDADDPTIFYSQSRARHTSNVRVGPAVEEAILSIRDEPPDNLRRTPGPLTILYFLGKEEELKEAGHYLPRSTSTIWKILKRHDRILQKPKRTHQPEVREEPMAHWQLDYKSVSTVPAGEEGKKQHVVETLNCVDKGTSILVEAVPRADYNAETTMITLVDIFRQHGLPRCLTIDRDPRLVGSWTMREFPSALMRFLYVLGVSPIVCPPQRPDRNAFVERYHLSYQEECLQREKPDTLEKVIQVTDAYKAHYNYERPNQAITCQNQPPRVAFPDVGTDAVLPTVVDPDAWLAPAAKRMYKRRIDPNGSIKIGNHRYYVRKALAKQHIAVRVLPSTQELQVYLDKQVVKVLPVKGLYHGQMLLEDYVTHICREAVSEARRLQMKRRRR